MCVCVCVGVSVSVSVCVRVSEGEWVRVYICQTVRVTVWLSLCFFFLWVTARPMNNYALVK